MKKIASEIDRMLSQIAALIKPGGAEYDYSGSEICIRSYYYLIKIYQQERYDERLTCMFDFEGYLLNFEHVYEAIEGEAFNLEGTYNDAEGFNQRYLVSIVNFIEKNLVYLNEFPPKWFLGAVNISSKFISRNFPDVAVKHKDEGVILWESWIVAK